MTSKLFFILSAILLSAIAAFAQTSAFTFQGKLSDGATAASGTYQFQFKLYDANGVQIGQTLSDIPATVVNGIFTVNLDFGAAAFDGAARFIEIGVRPNCTASCESAPFTTLSPRQPIASTPYAVKSLKSEQANVAVSANDSLRLGGVSAANYTQNNDPRLSDARTPTPNSTYYIQNGTELQTTSNFNVSGEGKANIFNAATQFNLANVRVLGGAAAQANLFVGADAGAANPLGGANTFVGVNAGKTNVNGFQNSFFGQSAGLNNQGSNNSFFGNFGGASNTFGNANSFFGAGAGYGNQTGGDNSFFGMEAGANNTTGGGNTFLGRFAGTSNTAENNNTFVGFQANGAAGITNATAIGANAVVTASNTMVLGTNVVTVKIPGSLNVANTFSANVFDSNTVYKINGARVFHLTGTDNTFVGGDAGNSVTTGGFNSFFGKESGKNTAGGFNNSFFGAFAGRGNTTGANNSFFGANAGLINNGTQNSFVGSGAGLNNLNGSRNSFVGSNSGLNTTNGSDNTFVGVSAGKDNLTGKFNTFVGALSGLGENSSPTGDNNTAIGYNTSFAAGVSNSIAIGANVRVSQSDTIEIGNIGQFVGVPNLSTSGKIFANELKIGANILTASFNGINLGTNTNATNITASGFVKAESIKGNLTTSGNNTMCFRFEGTYAVLASCSSSIRYKTNIENFTRGLELVKQLRPVTFNWKSDNTADVGFVAEEVNAVEPLLNNYNQNGEIEGVKYAQITTALVNAVKEQQMQIETGKAENQNLREQLKQQQSQIDALKTLVCQTNPTATVCAAPEKK